MALITLGTNATTSLSSLVFYSAAYLAPDVASIATGILSDTNPAHPISPGSFSMGRLHIPGRGILNVKPGDYVAIDSTGWPILISANAIANGPWTHT